MSSQQKTRMDRSYILSTFVSVRCLVHYMEVNRYSIILSLKTVCLLSNSRKYALLFIYIPFHCVCSSVPSITNGRLNDWETRTTREASLLIKLPTTHIIYKIVVHNKSTSSITLKVGLNKKKLRSFCSILNRERLPHNRVTEVFLGHLPSRYIHIICHQGYPIGFNRISVYGMSLEKLQQRFGQPALAPLLYNTPASLLFGVQSTGLVLKKKSTVRKTKKKGVDRPAF